MEEILCQKNVTHKTQITHYAKPNSDHFSVSLRVEAAVVMVRKICHHSKTP